MRAMRNRKGVLTRPLPLSARQSVQRIVAAYKPERVVLFGSYARGEQTADSDIDLLVVKRRPKERRLVDRIGRILELVPYGTPVEPIVLTPSEIAGRLRANDFFLQEVLESGVVLYEKSA